MYIKIFLSSFPDDYEILDCRDLPYLVVYFIKYAIVAIFNFSIGKWRMV